MILPVSMEKYKLILKNEKIKFYNRISKSAIIINAIVLLSFSFSKYADKQSQIISVTASIFVLTGLFLIQKFYSANNKWGVGYVVIFDLLIVTWILLEYYWIAGVHLIFSILSALAVKKPGVIFYTDMITIFSILERKIMWNQLNNVVLKDGLLTLDFKNNKIIQQIIEETAQPVNEKEFNEFCRQQLNK